MTLDEAIAHEKELAEENYMQGMLCHANPNDDELDGCIERGKYHEQLAEWLKELKAYKRGAFTRKLQPLVYKQGYNKAIEDFVSRLETVSFTKTQWDLIKTIAEQLKVGENREYR